MNQMQLMNVLWYVQIVQDLMFAVSNFIII